MDVFGSSFAAGIMFSTRKASRWLHNEGMNKREIWGSALCLRVQPDEISSQEEILRTDLASAPEFVIPLDSHELRDQGGEPQLHTV